MKNMIAFHIKMERRRDFALIAWSIITHRTCIRNFTAITSRLVPLTLTLEQRPPLLVELSASITCTCHMRSREVERERGTNHPLGKKHYAYVTYIKLDQTVTLTVYVWRCICITIIIRQEVIQRASWGAITHVHVHLIACMCEGICLSVCEWVSEWMNECVHCTDALWALERWRSLPRRYSTTKWSFHLHLFLRWIFTFTNSFHLNNSSGEKKMNRLSSLSSMQGINWIGVINQLAHVYCRLREQ